MLTCVIAGLSSEAPSEFGGSSYSQNSRFSLINDPLIFTASGQVNHTMSAPRRSTRAASRAASSRGTSPAISEQDIPATPSARRTTRRSAASPLPAVGLRTSTAYGTNSTAQPSSMRGPDSQDPITNVLTGLLDPVREEDDEEESSRKSRLP